MKKYFISAAIACATMLAFAASKKEDPVLMTINGKDVHQSEFEYLYRKNNTQQLQPQTLDEYVDMFVKYKLKVADAEAAGIDTTESFLKEYTGFRNDLSRPYLRDSTVQEKLIAEAYDRMKVDLSVSHVMISFGNSNADIKAATHTLDSLRTVILEGKATFAEIAEKYSIDGSTKKRGGKMGWIVPGRFPLAFEDAAYNTPTGEISPVVNSGYGLHIVRVDERRPNRGEVLVQHILKLTRGMDDEAAARQKAAIDSIYAVVTSPDADFSDVATRESQDPGSAKRGGMLDWFGAGTMIAEFDSVAFAIPNGAISKPFATAYGYHIIHRLDHRPLLPLDSLRSKIEGMIAQDERSTRPERVRLDDLIRKYNSSVNEFTLDEVERMIADGGGYDSAMIARLSVCELPILSVNGIDIPVKDAMPGMPTTASKDAANARALLADAARRLMEAKTLDTERDNLALENPEYRNLINEYRDGILLFEISNRNVWDKASKDKEGLEKFFQANKGKYTWDKPRFKGYIIFAANDSILEEAKAYTNTLTGPVNPETFATEMRQRIGRDIKVERVIASEGENPITDYLAFGAEKPENKGRWTSYYSFQGKILEAPEEAIDVRGAVTTDYQAELEKQWVAELYKKYPVKINKKVLKNVK